MTRSRQSIVTPILATGIAVAGVFAVQSESHADSPATQPTPLAVGPIAYYTASCARCHGDVGTPYVGVTRPKTGAALRQIVDDMAYGPAQAPIEGEALDQQTALHEAMFGKTPFVWLDTSRTDVTAGEVLPGTTLAFEPATPIKVDGTRFELPKKSGTLVATRNGKSVRLPVK